MSENVQKKLKARVIHKHKTESAWRMDVYDSDGNLREDAFVPENGELIIFDPEKDGEVKRFKFGDGKTNVINLPFTGMVHEDMFDENGVLQIPNGIVTEGCTAYAKAGSAIGIKTYSGSKSFTIWGLGEGSTVDADEGTYLVDGIEVFDETGERIYGVEVGDDYSCHVCYTNATTSNSRQRSFYGKVTAIEETEQVSPAGKPLYAITVSPFFGIPAGSVFRPFITNEDGTISDEEPEYLDAYGVDQERNTFRIPSKPLLGDRVLGAYAYATGYQSTANTRGGFTAGRDNIADGNYGSALGYANKAAYAALGTGVGTKAIGIKSFTQGANTEAYQEAASAMGVRTKVDGFGAHGTGVDVTVNGKASHGEGLSTVAGMKWTKIESVANAQKETAIMLTASQDLANATIYLNLSQPLEFDLLVVMYIDYEWSDGSWAEGDAFCVIPAGYTSYTYKNTSEDGATIDTEKCSGLIELWTISDNSSYTELDYTAIDNYSIQIGKDIDVDASFTLSSNDHQFAVGDTYTILQTNRDKSYLDVGKITGIDENIIYVDVLPEFNDDDGTKVARYFGVRKKPNAGTIILGEAIHAEGSGSQALYTGAHAGGTNSIATNTNAFAHGAVAKATSRHAIALGDHAEAKDAFGVAIGQYTKTGRNNQVAVGKYNAENPNAAFVVGWGTNTSPKNIFTVDTNGNGTFIGGVNAASFNGYTINKSVPSDAVFKYYTASVSIDGLMSAQDKKYIEQVKENLGSHKVEIDVPENAVFTDTQSDWTETDLTSLAYINNKPAIVTDTGKSSIVLNGVEGSGFINDASGEFSIAAGRATQALQKSAVATGINTISYGFNSFTSGDKNIAFGNNSVAFGSGIQFKDDVTSTSNATIRTAWESGTEYNAALGVNSEVHGRGNLANADRTFVHGISNRANFVNQFITGKYNDYGTTGLFVVGDGTSKTDRSNAFEVFGKKDSKGAYATVGGKKVVTEDELTDKQLVTSVTYTELKALRDNNELISGMFYRITDYECTTTQANTRAKNNRFDIIVQALSTNTLSENAKADYHRETVWTGTVTLNPAVIQDVDNKTLVDNSVTPYYYEYIDFADNNLGMNYHGEDIFVAYGYEVNDQGVTVPVLYKTNERGLLDESDENYNSEFAAPDFEDPFYYVGRTTIDGETYDRWRKIELDEIDGLKWESTGKVYLYTNVITEQQEGGSTTETIIGIQPDAANLLAWELKYYLDNDTMRFAWASNGVQKITNIESAFSNGQHLIRQPSFDDALTDTEYAEFKYAWGTQADIDDDDTTDFVYSRTELLSDGDLVFVAHQWGLETEYQSVEVVGDGQEGKGVIYYMKDEHNNECPYDFKNIQFRDTESYISKNSYYYTFAKADVSAYNNYIGAYYHENKLTLNCNLIYGHTINNVRIENNCNNVVLLGDDDISNITVSSGISNRLIEIPVTTAPIVYKPSESTEIILDI